MAKRLSVRAERVIAGMMGTSLFLLTLSCSIELTATDTIYMKKNIQFIYHIRKPWKGVKKDTKSETIQNDSISIKEMLIRHTQGIIDPVQEKEGLYDGEDVTHDLDIGHRSQKTELELLDYITNEVPNKEEINETVEQLNVLHPKEELKEVEKEPDTPAPDHEPT